MNCAQVRAHLGDHLEGDLDGSVRAQVDGHLEACPNCANELQELRSTVALVRSLPDLAAPVGLADAVMRRIEDGEGRRQRLSFSVRRWIDPRLALPLAAGVAGILFYAGMNEIPVDQSNFSAVIPSAEVVADQIAIDKWEAVPPTLSVNRAARSRLAATNAVPARRSRTVRPRLAAIDRSANSRMLRPDNRELVVGFFGRMDPDSARLDLDRELERAKGNPEAFLRRLNETAELDRRWTVAPLVVLADRRGEARLVAARLRSTPHPLAVSLAAQFEQERYQPADNLRTPRTSFEY